MCDDPIDQTVFRDLEDAMGADFVAELVATFVDEAPGMRADLITAAKQAQAEPFRRAAHSIKSNAALFGAVDLAEQARRLELSEAPQAGADVDAALAAFDAQYHRALAALTEMSNG